MRTSLQGLQSHLRVHWRSQRSVMTSAKASQAELVQRCMVLSPAPLVDIGVNLVDSSFDKDRPGVIQRARDAGVAAIVVTGCTVRSAQAAARLCESTPDFPLFFTAGVHPHNAKDCDELTLDALKELAAHDCCVAIGECGLDFNRNFSSPDVQETWFAAQVRLAVELGKPLFMHCRDAGERFAEILHREGACPSSSSGSGGDNSSNGGSRGASGPAATAAAVSSSGGCDAMANGVILGEEQQQRLQRQLAVPGVIHCFTGNAQDLRACLDLGLHIGITGWVCDDRPERGGAELAALLPSIPSDRLMIETDAPYLPPRTIKPAKARPHRNEPALLPHVLLAVAGALGQEQGEVARRTSAVARAFFRLPDLPQLQQ